MRISNKTEATSQEKALAKQQKLIEDDKDINVAFTKALEKICELNSPPRDVCIVAAEVSEFHSYGVPKPYLEWIPLFLEILKAHLGKAGILINIISMNDAPIGRNLYAFMQSIEDKEIVFLVGSEALYERHTSQRHYEIKTQLAHIRKKIKMDSFREKTGKVIRLLLSGDIDTSFPTEFDGHDSIVWNNKELYFNNFIKLLNLLYPDKKSKLDIIWQEFLNSLSLKNKIELFGEQAEAKKTPIIRLVSLPPNAVNDKKQEASASVPAIMSAIPRIAWKELNIGKEIGNGSYGDVYKGKWFGKDVAIKQLLLKTLSDFSTKEFIRESEIMWKCDSPHIVGLRGVCVEPGHFAMVMEYLSHGSLRQRLQDDRDLSWEQRWQLMIDIAEGIKYLHSQEILHRDLKSFNILLDAADRAKIADFGLAKIKLEINTSTRKSGETSGSIRWCAPELFKRHAEANKASDIYSLGMIFWEIVTRQLPFADAVNEQMVISWISDGGQEKIPPGCPKLLAEIIQSCWAAPDQRPTADVIVTRLKEAHAQSIPKESKAMPIKEQPWHFDPASVQRPEEVKGYELISASLKDVKKVVNYYQHRPVTGYDIKSVQLIYSPDLINAFKANLKLLEGRHGNPAFAPKWSKENENAWRNRINNQLQEITAPYLDSDFPNVKLLPVWHGTKPEILPSLFKAGYANLATTDAGYFGKGLYSSYEPEYAYKIYCRGALLMNWVALYSAYPVIDGDMGKLNGRGNYQNYDAHFVPVVPEFPDPDNQSFIPCKQDQPHQYTEIVVFDRSQCLPQFLVELQPSLPKSPVPAPLSLLFKQSQVGGAQKKSAQELVQQGADFKMQNGSF